MNVRYWTAGPAAAAIVACAGNEGGTAVDTAAANAAIAAEGGTARMPGMAGMATSGDTATDQMRAHMTAMEGASGDSLMRMARMHRQMAANMIARFNREMAQMNMPDDPKWRATLDSVRQDLAGMPELSAEEMERMIPAHHTRVTRLIEMHRAMMANMKM